MSDDPAVRAAYEAQTDHHFANSTAPYQCTCGRYFPTGVDLFIHRTAMGVEAARPIIEAEYQNRMVELTKAPITAADLSELAINDLTDAERDAFVAALTEGRTSEDRAARAARVRAKILGEDAQSEGGTSWSSPEADPLGDMAAYAEEQKQLELRRLTGEPELDDQVSITGQYPPTGDTVWPPADNGEPEPDPAGWLRGGSGFHTPPDNGEPE